MKKWLAAGLLSVPLMSNPAPMFAQTPATPAAVVPADRDVYRPADEGWSVRVPKGWTTTGNDADQADFPKAQFSHARRHQLVSGGEVKAEVFAVKFARAEPLSEVEKAGFMMGAVTEVEKKFGKVVKTRRDPKALGLPDSYIVEDWDVRVGSGGQFECRLTFRVVLTDLSAYTILAGGERGVSDAVRAVIDSFRVDPNEAPAAPRAVAASPSEVRPRPGTTVVTAKPPTTTDAANRPARPAPGPASTPPAPALPALFESLGYTAKNVGTGAEPIYELRFHRDGWNYVLKCQFSSDKQVLWLFSNVGGEGVDPSRLSPSAVLALLGENDKDRLAYFSFNADRKQFCLNTAIDPKQLSAEVLRERIGLLTAVVKETAPAWGALAPDRK